MYRGNGLGKWNPNAWKERKKAENLGQLKGLRHLCPCPPFPESPFHRRDNNRDDNETNSPRVAQLLNSGILLFRQTPSKTPAGSHRSEVQWGAPPGQDPNPGYPNLGSIPTAHHQVRATSTGPRATSHEGRCCSFRHPTKQGHRGATSSTTSSFSYSPA